jgi:hypothetical protein
MSNAILIIRHKEESNDDFIIKILIWRLSYPLRGCLRPFKSRFHFVTNPVPALSALTTNELEAVIAIWVKG